MREIRHVRGEPFDSASLDCARDRQGERGGGLQIVLLILGGLVLVVLLAVLAAVWVVRRGVQVETKRSGGTQQVEIRTPFGEIAVRKAEDAARRLKLPIYPGAVAKEESASVRLRGRIGEEEGGLDITVAQFRTFDPFERVDTWYRKELGPAFKREEAGVSAKHKNEKWREHIHVEAGAVAYTQETEGRARGVVLEPKGSQVEITLFEVGEARHQ